MIDDEGASMVQYTTTFSAYGFDVGPKRIYQGLSNDIFTNVDFFLEYVDYLLKNDPEAQSEKNEICAFVIDQQMPPRKFAKKKEFLGLKLAKNHASTGGALMEHLYDCFTREVTSNPIRFFILSQIANGIQNNGDRYTYQFLTKKDGWDSNCDTIRRALDR